jgi:hypothetical protein
VRVERGRYTNTPRTCRDLACSLVVTVFDTPRSWMKPPQPSAGMRVWWMRVEEAMMAHAILGHQWRQVSCV